jgi:formyltetrahydrofolate deformylase
VSGIVAAVTTYLADNGCYIGEMAQFDDEFSGRFFMRAVFRFNDGTPATSADQRRVQRRRPGVRHDLGTHDTREPMRVC